MSAIAETHCTVVLLHFEIRCRTISVMLTLVYQKVNLTQCNILMMMMFTQTHKVMAEGICMGCQTAEASMPISTAGYSKSPYHFHKNLLTSLEAKSFTSCTMGAVFNLIEVNVKLLINQQECLLVQITVIFHGHQLPHLIQPVKYVGNPSTKWSFHEINHLKIQSAYIK
jgi:hypothetical protein